MAEFSDVGEKSDPFTANTLPREQIVDTNSRPKSTLPSERNASAVTESVNGAPKSHGSINTAASPKSVQSEAPKGLLILNVLGQEAVPARPNGMSVGGMESLPGGLTSGNAEEEIEEEEDEARQEYERRPATEPKMVSFARDPLDSTGPDRSTASPVSPSSRPTSGNLKTGRSSRFFARMKSSGSPSSPSPASSPRNPSFLRRIDTDYGRRLSDGAENDADYEDQTDEEVARTGVPIRKRRRILAAGSSPTPSTPRSFAFAFPERSQESRSSSEQPRFRPVRSATTNDAFRESTQGVSEDEGRSRLAAPGQWRRRSSAWMHDIRLPGSTTGRRNSEHSAAPSSSRPRNLRRSTAGPGLSLSAADGDVLPSTWRMRREPAARRWRELKAGLKLKGLKKKDAVSKIDQDKSAELVAELLAGSPAAIILASHFSGDERDHKRIPALLEQLKIIIVDSQYDESSGPNRNVSFRINLEYGSGMMRMKWTIERTVRDFWRLHTRFGAQAAFSKIHRRKDAGQKVKIPRFPRSAFPFAKELTGQDFEELEEAEEAVEEPPDPREPATPLSPGERPGRYRRGPSWMHHRQTSSNGPNSEGIVTSSTDQPVQGSDAQANNTARRSTRLAERQKQKLEAYLKSLIKYVMFRPGSNRLCRFLELSALGIKLAVEGGYHGKEGTLTIQSGKGLDFRRAWTPSLVIQRHKPMWFLVRHSYLVCVGSPEDMNIYDVFLVDKDFMVTPKRPKFRDQTNAKDLAKTAGSAARHPQHHILRLANSERRLRLIAKNEDQLKQFQASLNKMAQTTPWSHKNRFDSFAPIRENVFAQWLVDARDYMWNVSRALENARDVIYIHDWWLSPELYMRRPGAISHKWRLDRILKRKADQGVKVFVILYRNIESAIPIDSEYTKFALLDLHPNIFVQRSPNQYREAVFFWAHHEKLVVVDHIIAFCGGVDLCFGRWDSPDHRLVDDRPTGWEGSDMSLNADTCQMWPGKDYSNPRVRDFFTLNEPFAEMYDRSKVPRMPWHDIGMQMVGQPARDLTRHFVQRWNFLLRQRKTSRPTPFLLPPPDFSPSDLESLGLEGTCTIQVLRSACEWSIGTPGRVEHSIMNAYCKLIQTSEHFVYIENQFFISSCTMDGTKMRNGIGDALVERIILAHERGDDWAAVIVIPLMPGFQNTVDAPNGTSIRLIMQCQYHSICRGESSIFGKLGAAGIDPHKYIKFYSLRTWAKIGPTKALVTEQLYIHAKCMVVDDRYAIIGSANINERSMMGDRDSELASLVFDNDMIDSTMAGRPYKVGRFPHTLRMRLMREHLGVDVDHLSDEASRDVLADDSNSDDDDPRPLSQSGSEPSSKQTLTDDIIEMPSPDLTTTIPNVHTFNHDANWEQENSPYIKRRKPVTRDHRVTGTEAHKKDVEGYGVDNMRALEGKPSSKMRDTILLKGNREVLVDAEAPDGKGSVKHPVSRKERTHAPRLATSPSSTTTKAPLPPPGPTRLQTQEMGLTLRSQLPPLPTTDDTDIGGPPLQQTDSKVSSDSLNSVLAGMRRPIVEPDCMRDPLNESFIQATWHAVAQNNTHLYRRVFRCMPDALVTNWAQYSAAVTFGEQFAHSQGMDKSSMKMQQEAPGKTGPPGHDQAGLAVAAEMAMVGSKPMGLAAKLTHKLRHPDSLSAEPGSRKSVTEKALQDGARLGDYSPTDTLNEKDGRQSPSTPDTARSRTTEADATAPLKDRTNVTDGSNEKDIPADGESTNDGPQKRRRRATTKSGAPPKVDPILNKADAERLMDLVQGNLVEWPYEWLSHEEKGGKWLYAVDQMSPIEIYD